jgi:hypothetical protein
VAEKAKKKVNGSRLMAGQHEQLLALIAGSGADGLRKREVYAAVDEAGLSEVFESRVSVVPPCMMCGRGGRLRLPPLPTFYRCLPAQ